MSTLVSVVIPSFNHVQYVAEAIDSVLAQTVRDIELIVIDDGSTDGSADVISRAIERDPRGRMVRRGNRGLTATLNEGLTLARGTYFAYLGSDDLWEAEKLERQIASMNAVRAAAAFSDCWVIDEAGNRIARKGATHRYRGGDIYLDLLLFRFQPPSPTNLFVRERLVAIGGFDESLDVEDHDVWVRLSKESKIAYVDEPLASFRVHASNTTSSHPERIVESNRRTVLRALSLDPGIAGLERRIWSRFWAVAAALWYSVLDLSAARRAAIQSLRRNLAERDAWAVLLRSLAGRKLIGLVRSGRKPRLL